MDRPIFHYNTDNCPLPTTDSVEQFAQRFLSFEIGTRIHTVYCNSVHRVMRTRGDISKIALYDKIALYQASATISKIALYQASAMLTRGDINGLSLPPISILVAGDITGWPCCPRPRLQCSIYRFPKLEYWQIN